MAPDAPIIMVDDDDTDRVLAERCYRKVGAARPFLTLESGAALLAYLDEVDAGRAPLPALVLLDINMPVMDGFKTLELVRSRDRFTKIPIITMFTHSDRPADRAKVSALGANGFQTKPDEIAGYVAFLAGLDAYIEGQLAS